MILFLASALLSVTITLPETATVRGNDVTLGEIAAIRGAEPADLANIQSLALGYSPAPGYARVFTRDQIATQLRALLPKGEFAFAGAERCRVQAELEIVRGDSIRAAADEAMRALLAGRDATAIAEGAVADLQVPKSESKLDLRAAPEHRDLRPGTWSIAVQVWVDGSLYQTTSASYRVELFETVPILVRDVRRGEVVTAESFGVNRVRLSGDSGGEPLSANVIPGAVALRDLPIGTVITSRDVKCPDLVKRGDVVQISITKGSITAHSTAIAAQDGALGARIRVTTNSDTKRELVAIVVGKNSVQVDLSNLR
jgi:flagellar basal body P-ring formation protein FlgA